MKYPLAQDLIHALATGQAFRLCGPVKQPETTLELLRRLDLDAGDARAALQMLSADFPLSRAVCKSCLRELDFMQFGESDIPARDTLPLKVELAQGEERATAANDTSNDTPAATVKHLPNFDRLPPNVRAAVDELNRQAGQELTQEQQKFRRQALAVILNKSLALYVDKLRGAIRDNMAGEDASEALAAAQELRLWRDTFHKLAYEGAKCS